MYIGCAVEDFTAYLNVGQDAVVAVILQSSSAHFQDVGDLLIGIFISKADGAAGQIGYPVPARKLGKSEIAGVNTACTETFLRIGPFDSEQECRNVKSYIETKFFRCLVGARKNKNMTQSTY